MLTPPAPLERSAWGLHYSLKKATKKLGTATLLGDYFLDLDINLKALRKTQHSSVKSRKKKSRAIKTKWFLFKCHIICEIFVQMLWTLILALRFVII